MSETFEITCNPRACTSGSLSGSSSAARASRSTRSSGSTSSRRSFELHSEALKSIEKPCILMHFHSFSELFTAFHGFSWLSRLLLVLKHLAEGVLVLAVPDPGQKSALSARPGSRQHSMPSCHFVDDATRATASKNRGRREPRGLSLVPGLLILPPLQASD